MKIIDLKCAVIGENPVVRIDTDEDISGLGEIESTKNYLKPQVLFYKRYILGQDPTNVERVMQRIRRLGAFKPWGSAVSAIEMALWDIAGKAAGLPVYKLLGGKVRDKVRVYNGGVRPPLKGFSPQDYAENARKIMASSEGFTIVKWGIGFHGPPAEDMFSNIQGSFYGEVEDFIYGSRGLTTERGLKHIVACVKAMKEVLGDEIGLALDCGPGWTVPSAIKLAKALEPFNVMWLEDLIAGDYTPYTFSDIYHLITCSTSTPIHTGEQIYLRQGFKDLIEKHAVDIIGPDPCDVGGLAELKWVAEFADLHGILVAPHGIFDGLIGLAALVQLSSTLPKNYIAFEYPIGKPKWWYDVIEGLPTKIVRDGFIEVWDTPGLGVELNEKTARKYLPDGDTFFN